MYQNIQDVPGYSGRQSRRRPQLSESEDGEPVTGRDLGKVARQDTFSRNTFPARGKQRSLRAPDTSRSVSVPPKPFSSLPSDMTREPAYWGLAHPLSQVALYLKYRMSGDDDFFLWAYYLLGQKTVSLLHQTFIQLLLQAVLYPTESPSTSPPTLTCELARLPALLGSLLTPSSSLHSPALCLACYRLQLSAR